MKKTFYRRMILTNTGSLYEGRWAKTKKEYMHFAEGWIKEGIKAVGAWEEKEVSFDSFDFFYDKDEEFGEES